MVTSFYRGHKIHFFGGLWYYADTLQPILHNKNRACIKCGKTPTLEGYDACLGHLQGVISACCGHGITKPINIKGVTNAKRTI